MQIFFILLGSLGLIWCLLPKIVYHVLNIGNITGILVFLILLLVGIFWKGFKNLVRKLWGRKAGKVVLSLLGTLIIVIFVFVIIETACMFGATREEPKGDETLVVLGSYVSKSGPSVMTKCRLDAAYGYLVEHPEAKCVVSGGQGETEPWPEAKAMKEYLVDLGIDADRIYEEDQSENTRENLKYTMEVIRENGLKERIVIVSNEFHLYRAGRIADRLGIEHAYLSASSPWAMFSSYYIRELYAILADWFIYS